jgi:hypothetical protein
MANLTGVTSTRTHLTSHSLKGLNSKHWPDNQQKSPMLPACTLWHKRSTVRVFFGVMSPWTTELVDLRSTAYQLVSESSPAPTLNVRELDEPLDQKPCWGDEKLPSLHPVWCKAIRKQELKRPPTEP